jgi:hypothetical protein
MLIGHLDTKLERLQACGRKRGVTLSMQPIRKQTSAMAGIL